MKKHCLFPLFLIFTFVISNATIADNRVCFAVSKDRKVLKINDEKSFLKLCLDEKCLKGEYFNVKTNAHSGIVCPLNIKHGSNKYMQFLVVLEDGKELKSPIIKRKVAYYKLHVKGKILKSEEFPYGYITKTIRESDTHYPEGEKTLYDSLMLDSLPKEERKALEQREKAFLKQKELERQKRIKENANYQDDSVCFAISPKNGSPNNYYFDPYKSFVRYCVDEACSLYVDRKGEDDFSYGLTDDIICVQNYKLYTWQKNYNESLDPSLPERYDHYNFHIAFEPARDSLLKDITLVSSDIKHQANNNFHKIIITKDGQLKTKRFSSKNKYCHLEYYDCKGENPLYKEITNEQKEIDSKKNKIYLDEYKKRMKNEGKK